MALTASQQTRANAVNARSAQKRAARTAAASSFQPTGMAGAVTGETAAQKFARTQANVKNAAAQTSRASNPPPGSVTPVMRANKGQVYSDNRLVADYGYGAQAEALANRYIQTKGQSFGPIARSEGAAVTAELAPYSPQPTVAPIARTPKPVASVTPVDRNFDAETAARQQIATERGIDTTKASAATLSLLNEAVNQNVYGKARPTFNRSAITPGPTASTPVVTDTFTPDEVQSIVTSDSAEKYRADELANITDLQSESFDTAAGGFDGLMSTDSEILDVQYAGMDAQALLEQRRAFYQDQYISLKSEISRIYDEKQSDYKQQAAQQMGSTISQLASMGALGTTTAGVQYVNDVERINQAKLVSFAAEEAAALESAFNAFQEADFKTAQEMIDNAKATREEIRTVKTEALANQQKMMELKKLEREEASQTISAMVDSGMDISTLPPGYLNYLDSKGGYVPGTSEGLWNTAQADKAAKAAESEEAKKVAALDAMSKLQDVLGKMPPDQYVDYDGGRYYGTDNGLVFDGKEIDKATGDIVSIFHDKKTGKMTTNVARGVLRPQVDYQIQEIQNADGSSSFWYVPEDPTKGGAIPVSSGQSGGAQGISSGDIEASFPEGTSYSDYAADPSVQAKDFWCLRWAANLDVRGQELMNMVGDTIEEKRAAADQTIGFGEGQTPPKAGDFVLTNEDSTFGHFALVKEVRTDPATGRQVAVLSESNYKPLTVTHSRTLALDADNMESSGGKILGFIHAQLRSEYSSQNQTDVSSSSSQLGDAPLSSSSLSVEDENTVDAVMSGTISLDDISVKDNRREVISRAVDSRRKALLDAGDFSNYMASTAGGRDVSDTEVANIAKSFTVLDQINDLNASLSGLDTGPLLGVLRSNNPYDVKAQAVKAQLQAIIPSLARGTYGEVGVLTDADIQNYAQTLPNLTQPQDLQKAVLAMTVKTIQRSLENKIKSLAAAHRDVSGYSTLYADLQRTADSLLGSIGSGTTSGGVTPPTPEQESVFGGLFNSIFGK